MGRKKNPSGGTVFNFNKRLGKYQEMDVDDVLSIQNWRNKSTDDNYPIFVFCKKCNQYMNFEGSDALWRGQFRCEKCGSIVHNEDVWDRVEKHDNSYDYIYQSSSQKIPSGCKSCGGPYPSCKISCPLFDD